MLSNHSLVQSNKADAVEWNHLKQNRFSVSRFSVCRNSIIWLYNVFDSIIAQLSYWQIYLSNPALCHPPLLTLWRWSRFLVSCGQSHLQGPQWVRPPHGVGGHGGRWLQYEEQLYWDLGPRGLDSIVFHVFDPAPGIDLSFSFQSFRQLISIHDLEGWIAYDCCFWTICWGARVWQGCFLLLTSCSFFYPF